MTAQTLIVEAMKTLGILDPGENPSAAEAAAGLTVLNNMIDSWSAERLNVFTLTKGTFALTTAQSYTIGSGGAFNITRPVRIESASCTLSGISNPVAVISEKEYAAIQFKGATAPLCESLYYDPAFPLGIVYVNPVANGASLDLYMWTALTQFSTLSTNVDFPPGYLRALIYNLAIDLAPQFGANVSDVIVRVANEAKAAIRAVNASVETGAAPPAGALSAAPEGGA